MLLNGVSYAFSCLVAMESVPHLGTIAIITAMQSETIS